MRARDPRASQPVRISLADAAPYRRLPQFAAPASGPSAGTTAVPVDAARRILGLPVRTPVLRTAARRVSTGEPHLDAA